MRGGEGASGVGAHRAVLSFTRFLWTSKESGERNKDAPKICLAEDLETPLSLTPAYRQAGSPAGRGKTTTVTMTPDYDISGDHHQIFHGLKQILAFFIAGEGSAAL